MTLCLVDIDFLSEGSLDSLEGETSFCLGCVFVVEREIDSRSTSYQTVICSADRFHEGYNRAPDGKIIVLPVFYKDLVRILLNSILCRVAFDDEENWAVLLSQYFHWEYTDLEFEGTS